MAPSPPLPGTVPAPSHLQLRGHVTFHEEPVHVGALSGRSSHVFPVLLGHFHRQTHFIQGPFVFPGHGLHDGREKGLWVEEPSQPHGGGQGEVCGPGFQLLEENTSFWGGGLSCACSIPPGNGSALAQEHPVLFSLPTREGDA